MAFYFLKQKNIQVVFHYQSLHISKYFLEKHDNTVLKNSDFYSDTLLRLPLYYELADEDVLYITNLINVYCQNSTENI